MVAQAHPVVMTNHRLALVVTGPIVPDHVRDCHALGIGTSQDIVPVGAVASAFDFLALLLRDVEACVQRGPENEVIGSQIASTAYNQRRVLSCRVCNVGSSLVDL